MRYKLSFCYFVIASSFTMASTAALADDSSNGTGGRLLLTSGVSQVEGAAGGGLTPWALIAGYDSKGQVGGSAYVTDVATTDFNLLSYGAAIGYGNRVEVSVSRQNFNTENLGSVLGLGHGFTISQNTVGVKLRLFGDAILEQDKILPQVSVGVMYKSNNKAAIVKSLSPSINSGNGADFYLSATKLLLSKNLLINATVRLTKANQFGILGFSDKYRLEGEGSIAYLVTRKLAVGGEYRMKPNNIPGLREDDAFDGFVAYTFNKHASLTLAYADLGNIVVGRQRGFYSSLQIAF